MEFYHTVIGLLVFVLGFGFIVFVHEFGHFAVAKWVGIRVEQFAVGMGHAIVSYRKGMGASLGSTQREVDEQVIEHVAKKRAAAQRLAGESDDEDDEEESKRISSQEYDAALKALAIGETEYRISWIPIGGYVKMLGQDDLDPEHRSTDPRSYNNKPVWARMCVISAGVVMNIIFGLIFFVFAFMAGVKLINPAVGYVAEGKNVPARNAYAQGHQGEAEYKGLQPRDQFVAVDGESVLDFTDIQQAAALSSKGKPIELVVQRPGETDNLIYRVIPERVGDNPFATIGISPMASLTLSDKEGQVSDRLKSEGVNLKWQLVDANGQPVKDHIALEQLFNTTRDAPVDLTFRNPEDGTTKTVERSARASLTLGPNPKTDPPNLIGFVPSVSIKIPPYKNKKGEWLSTDPDSPAVKAGMKEGDVIEQAGPYAWPDSTELSQAVGDAGRDGVTIVVRRDGKRLDLGKVKPRSDGRIGVELTSGSPIVARTLADTPTAQLADLVGGSHIIAINEQPVESFKQMQRVLLDALGKYNTTPADGREPMRISVTYQPAIAGTAPQTTDLTLADADLKRLAKAKWYVPVAFPLLQITVQTDNPIEAVGMGVTKTRQTMIQVYMTLMGIINARINPKEMRGPVGIAHVGTVIYRDMDFTFFIFFLGLISVNLAVINFLPIPVVDGGHMVFLIIEKIKGSPVSLKVQALATYAGMAMILCVFLFVSYQDVMRLLSLNS